MTTKRKRLFIFLFVPLLTLSACQSLSIGGHTNTPNENVSSDESEEESSSSSEFDDDIVHVESISFKEKSYTIYVGDTKTFNATEVEIEPSHASDKTFTLTSNDESILSVDGYEVSAISEGEVDLTATASDNGLNATTRVFVRAASVTPGPTPDPDPDPDPEPEPEPEPEPTDPWLSEEHDYVVDLANVPDAVFGEESKLNEWTKGNFYYWNSLGWTESYSYISVTKSQYNIETEAYEFGWANGQDTGWYDFQVFMELPSAASKPENQTFYVIVYMTSNFDGRITINDDVISLYKDTDYNYFYLPCSAREGADLSIQMGVSSTNSFISNGEIGFKYLAFDWSYNDQGDSSSSDEEAPETQGSGTYTTLVWNDEFSGTSLDTTKWAYQTGGGYGDGEPGWGWGNQELEWYQPSNVSVSDGSLVISARKEHPNGTDDYYQYTSGRIRTLGLYGTTYGRFEARIKYDCQQSMWPAFWMLPANSSIYGTWPASGEIDIMEGKGRLPYWSSCALHYGATDDVYQSTEISLSSAASNWHTYAVEWSSDKIVYYCDDVVTLSVSSNTWWSGGSNSDTAPFDVDFYLILNLAVGGWFDSEASSPSSDFTSANMYVDYVRVYK